MKVIFIWGPQNVGKMAISKEIAKYTNYQTLYAHNLMQMHSRLFLWIYGRFLKVEMDIYFEILEEMIASNTPGIILTKVKYLNRKRDKQLVESILEKFRLLNAPVQEIELYADENIRLERRKAELKAQGKSLPRRLTTPEKLLSKWYRSDLQVNSTHPFGLVNENYLKIDTTHQTVAETTQQIVDEFHLKPKV